MAAQRQAIDARRRLRRGCRPGRHHPGLRLRRSDGRLGNRLARWYSLSVGCKWAETPDRRRRLAGRVRRARRGRYPRRLADRRVRFAGAGRPGIMDYVANKMSSDPYSILDQVKIQAEAIGTTIIWSGVVSFIAYKLV